MEVKRTITIGNSAIWQLVALGCWRENQRNLQWISLWLTAYISMWRFCYGYISIWQSNHSSWYTTLHFVVEYECKMNYHLSLSLLSWHCGFKDLYLQESNRFCPVYSSCMRNSWFQPSSTTSNIKQGFHTPGSKLAVFKACSMSGYVAGEPIIMRHHADNSGIFREKWLLNVVDLISVIHIKGAMSDVRASQRCECCSLFSQFLFAFIEEKW